MIYSIILSINFFVLILIFFNIKKKEVICFKTFFYIYFICYSSAIFFVKSINAYKNFYYVKIYLMSLISFVAFNFGYKIFNTKDNKKFFYLENKLKIIMYIFLINAFIIEIYIYMCINLKDFFLASRAKKMLMMSEYSKFTFFYTFLILSMTLSLILWKMKRKKKYKIIFVLTFFNCIFIALLEISRAKFLSIIIPILFLYQKQIKNKIMVFIGIIGLIIFTLWKSLLSSLFYGKLSLSNIKLNIPNEFYCWYTIGENILKDLEVKKISYLYGKSYMDTFFNLIFPITNSEPLSIWYVKNYEYKIFLIGGGRGFSGIVEGYLNFGIIGVVIYFFILGMLSKFLDNKMKNDIKFLLIGILFLSNVHKFFRSESYSLLKSDMWFGVYPILFLFFIINLKIFKRKKKKEKRKEE